MDSIANKYGETTEQLAWILLLVQEWHRIGPIASQDVQARMDERFPAEQHVIIWRRLVATIQQQLLSNSYQALS